MSVFFKNIFRSIKSNSFSVLSLVFFTGVIATVYGTANNLSNNLLRSTKELNNSSHLHDLVINETYQPGHAEFHADQSLAETSVISALSSTATRFWYQPTNSQEWKLSDNRIPLRVFNGKSPEKCTPIGGAFSNEELVFNFLDPSQIKFQKVNNEWKVDQNNSVIDVVSQCGVNGLQSTPFQLSLNSPNFQSVKGFEYVVDIFDKALANNKANSQGLEESGFEDAYLLDLADVNVSWPPKSSGKKVIVKFDSSGVKNTLSPINKTTKQVDWTFAYKWFYDYFQNFPKNSAVVYDNNHSGVSNLSQIQQKKAQQLVQEFSLSSSFSKIPLQQLASHFRLLLSKTNKNNTNDLQYHPIKFAQIFLKMIYYDWTKANGGANEGKNITDQLTALKKDLHPLTTHLGATTVNSNSTRNSLTDAQKYLFSATKKAVWMGMTDFWQALEETQKYQLLSVAESTIKQFINKEIKTASNKQVSEITSIINSYNIWNIDQLLNNFLFEGQKYFVPRKRTRSLLINSLNDDQPHSINTYAYKLINDTTIANNPNLVDQLNIISGNDLFYESNYDDYQILQTWLKNNDDYANYLTNLQEKPFVEMVLRAKFSNQKVKNTFQKHLNRIKANINDTSVSTINDYDRIAVVDYKKQIQTGKWSYNGYALNLDFIAIDQFSPTRVLDIEIQKIEQVPAPAYINSRLANFVVISPKFAEINHKTPISDEQYQSFKTDLNDAQMNQEQWDSRLELYLADLKNKAHIINLGDKELIVVGIGQRADFALPSVSLLNIIPDPQREALVFVNDYGYNWFLNSNPNAFRENYLGITIPQKVVINGKRAAFEKELANQLKTYNQEEKILFSADDPQMSFSASGVRVSFVNKIVTILQVISYLLIVLVSLLALFGTIILIRRYVKNNSAIFGNFCANGVSKLSIILSTGMFVIIPAVIGPLVGYFTGLFTQGTLFSLLKNYWFLQSKPEDFSFFQMMAFIVVPMVILSLVAFGVAAITLKASPLVLMRENTLFSQNKFSLKVNNLFNKFSPIWKFRLIVATNSIARILLLANMSALMMVIVVFILGNIGQFQVVASREKDTYHNGYTLYYRTPSSITTQTPLLSYPQLGQTYLNNIEQSVYVGGQKGLVTPEFQTKKVKFNKENPLLTAANITNFYQNSSHTYYTTFAAKMNDDYSQAVYQLNNIVHIKPENTNLWARPTILTNFLLRSRFDNGKQHYKSIPLPTPKEDKNKLFFHSSLAALENKITTLGSLATNSSSIVNSLEIANQPKLFDPDITDTYGKLIYYADYVPTIDEKNSANKDDTTKPSPIPLSPPTLTSASGEVILQKPDIAEDSLILGPDGQPLFQHLITSYKTKPPILANNNGQQGEYLSWTTSKTKEYNSGLKTENDDFKEFSYQKDGEQLKVKLPLLNRLYRDNANYWLTSIDDRDQFNGNVGFFKNRVLVKILLDNQIKINDFGLDIDLNLWDVISSLIKKTNYPDILDHIDDNHRKLIRRILNSRYAPYFVNRFMTLQQLPKKIDNFVDGAKYDGHSSYLIQESDLKEGINSKSSDWHNKIYPGLYYLDSNKTTYVHLDPLSSETGSSYDYKLFALLRPDFLYFVYALLNDPDFNTPDHGPTKLVFGDQVITADYDDPTKTWTTSGDPIVDQEQQVGLTATDTQALEGSYDQKPNGDQTFSLIEGTINNVSDLQKIYGLKQDRRGSYIKLKNQQGKIINHLLYQNDPKATSPKVYPVIINHYSKRKYKLKVNDIFTFQLQNGSKQKIWALQNNKSAINDNYKLKVVGIADNYFKDCFFIAQKNANEILAISPEYGFNGVFTKTFGHTNQLPLQLSQVLNIYSESGIYSGIEFNQISAAALELFTKENENISSGLFLQSPANYLKAIYQLPNEITSSPQNYLKQFNQVYGRQPLLPGITQVNESSVANKLFGNLSNTLEVIVIIILVVFLPLLVIMVLMITSLMIEDLKRLSIIMTMLGFNNWENSVNVLTYLLPVLAIALLVGVPIASLFTGFYVTTIFSSLAILLPIELLPWYFFSGVGILLAIFAFAFGQSFFKLKYTNLSIAMKQTGF